MDILPALPPPETVSTPTVTVVVPLFTGEKYIDRALRSAAVQTIRPHEIIVMGDASLGRRRDIVELFSGIAPVRFAGQPRGGRSSARNQGIAHATGGLIALLDPDHVWYPDHLETLRRPFHDNPMLPIGWTYSDFDEIDEEGNVIARSALSRSKSVHPKTDLASCIGQPMLILPSASLIAKAAFDMIGGFDESLSGYEDDDLFVRLLHAGYCNIFIEKALSQSPMTLRGPALSPQIAEARMTYVKKLAGAFPDDGFRNQFYVRDLIVPRFVQEVSDAVRELLRAGEISLADTYRAHIDALLKLVENERPPRVTTIVLLEDGEATIEAALHSVFSQTHAADEIFVIDNGSRDRGPALVSALAARWRITLITVPRSQPAKAWNLAAKHARGDLIAFLRDDAVWHPDYLATLTAPFQDSRDGRTAWVHCNAGNVASQDRSAQQPGAQDECAKAGEDPALCCIHSAQFIMPNSVIVLRIAFENIGGFDENLKTFEEVDLFTRLDQAGYRNAFVDQALVKRRSVQKHPRTPIELANARLVFLRKLAARSPRPAGVFQRQILSRFQENAVRMLKQALRGRDMPLADVLVSEIELLDGLAEPPQPGHRVSRERLVSVVIPLFNGAGTIEEALRSVFLQTRQPDEVIVVDDGSTDNGPALVERLAAEYPIRLLRKSNGGQSCARNYGIRHAHGDLIALLDQDDIWYPRHLAELVRPFEKPRRKPLGWSYSDLDEIDRHGLLVTASVLTRVGVEHPKTSLLEALRRDMFVLPSATVISRKAFEAVGGFDERLRGYEDDDLFVRLLRAGFDNVYIPQPLSRWRIYPESSSFSPRMAQSRMIFARKLMETFPDSASRNLFYTRDLLVPRFLHHVTENLRRALQARNWDLADFCAANIDELEAAVAPVDQPRLARGDFLITVVVTLRDGGKTIGPALQSALTQTCRPDEIIVVDEASVDDGPAIVSALASRYPIKLIPTSRDGRASARNLGVRHAHGSLIAFLDQDHRWYPTHLAELLKPYQERKSTRLGWVSGDRDEIDANGNIVVRSAASKSGTQHRNGVLGDILACVPDAVSVSLISRVAFHAVGGYDHRLSAYEDEDLLFRLKQAGFEHVFIDKPLSTRPAQAETVPLRDAARSRTAFIRSLISAVPDERATDKSVLIDLIAPRLIEDVLADLRRALKSDDDPAIDDSLSCLDVLDQYISDETGSPLSARPPVVTAIIPLYNGAPYITEALESVFAQTLRPDEVIVVDDGSTDNGPEIVSRLKFPLPIRLIRRENGGQSAARNTGVEHSHGDLIAFLDQDDYWYPNHLEELVKPFQKKTQSRLGWSYGDLDEIDKSGEMVTRGIIRTHAPNAHPKLDLGSCLGRDMLIFPSAVVVSRKAFLHVGGFNERLSGYEDDDLFLRLFRAGYQSAFLSDSVSKWRTHDNNSSYSKHMANSRIEYARMLIERFPDDPVKARYYARDLIAPRFLRIMAGDFYRAVLAKDRAQQKLLLDHMTFITRYLGAYRRLPLRYVIVPALRLSPVARMAVRRDFPMRRLLRGMI